MNAPHGFTPTEQMLDPKALATMLRISVRHLNDVRRDDPTFPQPRLFGTLPRWSPEAIRRWMAEAPGAEEAPPHRPQHEPAPPARDRGRRGQRVI